MTIGDHSRLTLPSHHRKDQGGDLATLARRRSLSQPVVQTLIKGFQDIILVQQRVGRTSRAPAKPVWKDRWRRSHRMDGTLGSISLVHQLHRIKIPMLSIPQLVQRSTKERRVITNHIAMMSTKPDLHLHRFLIQRTRPYLIIDRVV